jgi:peptide/nickel transport system substrate-binding protein
MEQFAVYPEASLGVAADSEGWFKHPITAGPFYIKEFVAQDHVVLAKNPYYWELGKDGKPLPYLDEVRVNQVPEDTTRVLQVRSGGLDGTVDVPYSQVKELQADTSGDIKFQLYPALTTYYLFINNTKPPFDDVKVRQALAMAMDRNALVESVTAGIGTPAYTFMPKGGMCFDPDIKIDYDVAKAKQLISESKYPHGYTGGIIYVPAGNQMGTDLSTFTQAMWAAVGINVEVQQIDAGLLADKFDRNQAGVPGDYDVIAGYQWTNQMVDPSQQTVFFSTNPAANSGYVSQAMSDLVDQTSKETDPVKRCKLYSDIQKLWNEDGVGIPLLYSVSRVITGKAVMDYYASPMAWNDFKDTWLSR